jgi:transposase
LNRVQGFAGFLYRHVRISALGRDRAPIKIALASHRRMRARCSQCRLAAPGYDRLPERNWDFVPLWVWGMPISFRYAPRRVQCQEHGVVVEHIPWSEGKRPVTAATMGFPARWARRLSSPETAIIFQTSWESVYRSVEWFVEWGLAHRQLCEVESIGVDEIHWGHGMRADNFLTAIYQIDAGCRRLWWIGKRRSDKTLRHGLKELGPEFLKGLRFVCGDMWKPYLNVIATEAGQAPHILDRFHIGLHMNQAVDEVRRAGSTRLRAKSKDQAKRLKNMRWSLLRKGSRVRRQARAKPHALPASKLATARAWEEAFHRFWKYTSPLWTGAFLDYRRQRAMRSRLEPIKKVARMLRAHEDPPMNWFRAKGEVSSGAVEGLNDKIRVITRRSYGFRTYKATEMALYRTLG